MSKLKGFLSFSLCTRIPVTHRLTLKNGDKTQRNKAGRRYVSAEALSWEVFPGRPGEAPWLQTGCGPPARPGLVLQGLGPALQERK